MTELTYVKAGATLAVEKTLHGMFSAHPLFLSLHWRALALVSLPQDFADAFASAKVREGKESQGKVWY